MKREWEITADLIKEVGVQRLAVLDGCICSNIFIRNVKIEVRCGKCDTRGIRVSSRWLEYFEETEGLRLIGQEVQRQLEDPFMGGPIPVSVAPGEH